MLILHTGREETGKFTQEKFSSRRRNYSKKALVCEDKTPEEIIALTLSARETAFICR
jgi:hypothetical protein